MEMETGAERERTSELSRYLSPLGAWALAFGCSVGWGAFVMPGTTFLPVAGPLGTALGIGIGALVMLIIGINYHYLINRYPDAGGTLTYTSKTFGYDHGFLSAWFLVLVYVAIMWANATALALIGRNLLGSSFQWGFHYQVFGYDVYLGEALLSMVAIILVSVISMKGKRLAAGVQIALAVLLFGGILICFGVAMGRHQGGMATLAPAFAPTGEPALGQILRIVVLAPWAFVGFESISHSAGEFRFSTRKTLSLMIAALVTGALAYILLAWLAVTALPQGYESWPAYLADLGILNGLEGLPTFFATDAAMGTAGLTLLGFTVLAGILTGLLGNLIAASRLLYAMAEENILPKWFGRLNREGIPQNAILALMCASLVIPFFGRTAIGWIVDVNTIGATIAYGYTSATAYVDARREGNRRVQSTGLVGLVVSIGFFLYFMASSVGAMSTESYLILATWGILGFVFFRYVFSKDVTRRFGKSTVVWIGLLFLIFFTSLMWVRQATNRMTETVVTSISQYYEERNPQTDPAAMADTEHYLQEQMARADRQLARNSVIQMGLIVAGLAIMFSVYTTMSSREKQMEVEKVRAENNSRAKSDFLSNMSHDIRTPMNAIVGYTTLAKKERDLPPKIADYLDKIDASSQHLLALINDVLEMSRIESGKLELCPVETDLAQTLGEVRDLFSTQMEAKGINFVLDTDQVKNPYVLCDKNRLNRVLLNLISNAYKFTPAGGTVAVSLRQAEDGGENTGRYELRVRDSGIGMSPEFAARIFEAFERERTSTVSGIQGTGLGMTITKRFVDLMGGTIEVHTRQGEGTEFVIGLEFPLAEAPAVAGMAPDAPAQKAAPDFQGRRLLVAEDNEINREIAVMLLEDLGFRVDAARDGKEAVEKVSAARPGDYDAVLMDIHMPGMNGYEATGAIRALPDPGLASIPIVAMTANAFAEDVQAARDAGMNGHIAKPIDVARMVQTLAEVLGQGSVSP